MSRVPEMRKRLTYIAVFTAVGAGFGLGLGWGYWSTVPALIAGLYGFELQLNAARLTAPWYFDAPIAFSVLLAVAIAYGLFGDGLSLGGWIVVVGGIIAMLIELGDWLFKDPYETYGPYGNPSFR